MLEKVCRLCLVKPSVSFSLLEDTFASMLEALNLTKVSPHDSISTIVCLKCLLSLKLAYNFHQQIKQSERKLLEGIAIKQEINEESEDLVKLCERKCTICGFCTDSKSINDHIREHFNCEHTCCGHTFPGFQEYKEHLLEVEHPEQVNNCKKCGAKFRYKTFYDLHVGTACVETKSNVQGGLSKLQLRSKQAIQILNKQNTKQDVLKVLGKTKVAKIRSSMTKLALSSLKTNDILKKDESRICNICYKKFTKKSFQCHSHETKTCTVCNKEVTKFWYKKHMEDHTSGTQICHLCGATLQNLSCLKAHINYSHKGRRYKCEKCGKVFKKKTSRDIHHQKEHIGEPTHICDTCGKGFFNAIFLKKHIKMKHLKLRPYVCAYCDKGFSSPYALKTHRRQHTNETPYKCEVCGDGFRQNVSLRAHRKSKHNIIEETTCHCKICGKGFGSSHALDSHMRLH